MQANLLPTLCFDILEKIAYQHHSAFKVLYCTCVRLSKMDKVKMMDLSTERVDYREYVEGEYHPNKTLWMLPNKNVHRGYDLPAMISRKGTQIWYQNGKIHRDNDLPAVIVNNGDKAWYQHNEHHRDGDLPAFIKSSGDLFWFKNGKRHRDNDLPAIIKANGTKIWYVHDEWIKRI